MPTIRSPGITSGLDVNGLVTQLVAAERAPAAQRIQRQDTRLATQISALGALRGSLANLQSSVNPLKTEAAFQTRTVDSSNSGVVTGTAAATAASGSFSVEVRQIASAQRIISNAIAGGTGATVGTGTLTVSMGGAAFDVVITDSNNTLGGIRDAINGATNNTGIRASIINTADGARLVLAARDTGAANTIRVTQAGGNGGLAAIVYDPPTTAGNYTQLDPAQDALIRVEGFDATSATNTFTGVIDGLTINAVGASPGSIQTLTVGNDQKATTERIQKFVTDFNSAANTLAALRRYNPTTREAGPLLGDALLRGIESDIRRQIATAATTADPPYTSLAAIGITTTKEGTLQINEAKLQAALTDDFDAVGRLFASTDGVTARLGATLDKALAADAQIANRTTNMQNQRRTLEKDTAALDRRMEAVEARYRTQFTALDTALAGLQSTANFLTQQLTNRPTS
jgi:flagellar hook-associated protein 2